MSRRTSRPARPVSRVARHSAPSPARASLGAADTPRAAALPTGTVTFLFTDIEGSTRLWDENRVAARSALAVHDSIIEGLAANQSGVVVRPRGEGDSRFAVFRRASDAVAAAIAIQRAFAAERWPGETPLRVRIAVHTGEADVRDGDYYGTAVNRCARLRSIASGGQTLLSGVTAAIVREQLPANASLLDLGMHRLRDLAAAEHVYQVVHPDIPGEFPPLRSLGMQLHNLPLQLSSFVGRERELVDFAKVLVGNRQLTLTGPGGAGKTRLALQVAAELVDQYTDGVWFVDLAPLADPGLVLQAIVSVLGVREQPGQPLTNTLTAFLSEKQLLLVLDNCEHLVPSCAHMAEKLLRTCPNIKILATSREQLGLVGETVRRIPSLELPRNSARCTFDEIAVCAAVRLFVERAQAADPSFQLSAANATSVAEICERLDGIPLALELAAARIQVLSPAQIATRLSDSLRLLVSGSRTAPTRQHTLRATFDWSYELLSDDEQRLLERLAAFAAGCTLESAEAVCGGGGMQPGDTLDLLGRLVAKSLVVVEPDQGDAPRYRLHVPLREYLIERLTLRGELERMRRQHAYHFLSVAEQAETPLQAGRQQRAWLERLEREHDDFRAALRWSHTNSETELEVRLAVALTRFWRIHGHLSEGRAWLSAALAEDCKLPTALRAEALNAAGSLATEQGDYAAAETNESESLRLYQELGDQHGVAAVLNGLAFIARNRYEDRPRARHMYEEMLTIARGLGDERLIASGLINTAAVDVDDGELERASGELEEAGGILRQLDANDGYAYCLQRLAGIAWLKGDYAGLRTRAEQSLAIFRELGHKVGITWTLLYLGRGAYETGDFVRARSLLEEALVVARELRRHQRIVWALQVLGAVSLAEGDLETARELLEQSLAIGDVGKSAGVSGPTLCYLARIARAQGDIGRACALQRECLELLTAVSERHWFPRPLEDVAALLAAVGHPLTAARLFGAADALRKSLSMPVPPVDQAEYSRAVAEARAAGGQSAFDREWAAGAAMPIDEVLKAARDALDSVSSQSVR